MKKIFFIILLSLLSQKVFAYDFCISSAQGSKSSNRALGSAAKRSGSTDNK